MNSIFVENLVGMEVSLRVNQMSVVSGTLKKWDGEGNYEVDFIVFNLKNVVFVDGNFIQVRTKQREQVR